MSQINFDSILSDFIAESNELLDKTESAALSLEQGFDLATVGEMFRAMHTIKGNSGLFDFTAIQNLSHSLENLLNAMRNEEIRPGMDSVDVILTCVDRLREMIANPGNSNSIRVDDLVAKISAFLPGPKSKTDGATNDTKEQKQNAQTNPDVISSQSVSNAQHPVNNGSGLKIPNKFLKSARESGKYLSLIYFDLLSQKNTSVLELGKIFSNLEQSGTLLMKGLRAGFSPLKEGVPAGMHSYIVTLSTVPGEMLLSELGINGKVKTLYAPETGGVMREVSEPVAVQKEETVIQTNMETTSMNTETIAEPSQTTPNVESNLSVGKTEGGVDFLKVPVKLIDALINMAGETVIARNELLQRIAAVRDASLEMSGKRMSILITRLQEGIMRTRLQELNSVFQKLPRLVRDVANQTGKKVDLIMTGGDVELDKTLIDAIGDSIMHMIRNSIDHGLESPEERKRIGKKETGIVKVSAHLRGGNVILSIRDDGKGLNLDKIRNSAVTKGLVTKEAAARATDQQVAEFVFLAGLSTADKVTQTSGRGVGMDVVHSNFKKLGGTVELLSEPGKGLTITATLPQTLTIVTCLMIKSSGTLFALPQQNVEELILSDSEKVSQVENHDVYDLRGHLLPLINLGKLLNLPENEKFAAQYIAVVHSERHRFGLRIDEIVNLEEIVVKRLGEHFAGLNFFSGAAIMGDGEAVLILDVPGLAKFANLQGNIEEEKDDLEKQMESVQETGFLLFGVFGQRFAVTVASVPRIEKITKSEVDLFMGMEVLQYRGEVVPVVHLDQVYQFDKKIERKEDIYLIIFHIKGMRIGIIADEIFNVLSDIPDLEIGKFTGHGVKGHAIIGNHTTLVIDAVELLRDLRDTKFHEITKEKDSEKLEGKV